MSHAPGSPDVGPTTSYYQGVAAERERIIRILMDYAPHLITDGLMQLIKGEQK